MNYRVGHAACRQDLECPLLLLRSVTISCELLGLAIIATCSVFGYGGTFWEFVIMPMLGCLILGSIVSFKSKSELIVPQLLFVISYLLTYFLVRDRVLANPKAFFVNGEPSGTLSLHYSYYVYALTEFGLVVMLLFIADNDKLRQGRKLVAGVLALIGILLPGLFDSYNFLLVCANYEKCYATANSAIDLHFAISLCELTIASAAGLAMVFLVSFIVSDGVLKNLFGDVRDRVMCEVLCDSCKLLSDKNLPTK